MGRVLMIALKYVVNGSFFIFISVDGIFLLPPVFLLQQYLIISPWLLVDLFQYVTTTVYSKPWICSKLEAPLSLKVRKKHKT